MAFVCLKGEADKWLEFEEETALWTWEGFSVKRTKQLSFLRSKLNLMRNFETRK